MAGQKKRVEVFVNLLEKTLKLVAQTWEPHLIPKKKEIRRVLRKSLEVIDDGIREAAFESENLEALLFVRNAIESFLEGSFKKELSKDYLEAVEKENENWRKASEKLSHLGFPKLSKMAKAWEYQTATYLEAGRNRFLSAAAFADHSADLFAKVGQCTQTKTLSDHAKIYRIIAAEEFGLSSLRSIEDLDASHVEKLEKCGIHAAIQLFAWLFQPRGKSLEVTAVSMWKWAREALEVGVKEVNRRFGKVKFNNITIPGIRLVFLWFDATDYIKAISQTAGIDESLVISIRLQVMKYFQDRAIISQGLVETRQKLQHTLIDALRSGALTHDEAMNTLDFLLSIVEPDSDIAEGTARYYPTLLEEMIKTSEKNVQGKIFELLARALHAGLSTERERELYSRVLRITRHVVHEKKQLSLSIVSLLRKLILYFRRMRRFDLAEQCLELFGETFERTRKEMKDETPYVLADAGDIFSFVGNHSLASECYKLASEKFGKEKGILWRSPGYYVHYYTCLSLT